MATTQSRTDQLALPLKKSLDEPDEVVEFPKGRVHLVTIGGITFDRGVMEPGWRWSEHMKPVAKTESCEMPHRFFITQGSVHIRMDDGTELDAGPGDAVIVPPGHDGWVTSDVACIMWGIDGDDQDFGRPAS